MDVLHSRIQNNGHENIPVLYSNTTCNVHHSIPSEDNNALPDKSYEGDSPDEICASKLDQEKIDKPANNDCGETCLFSKLGNTIQKQSYKETIRSDKRSSRNEDVSRCKPNCRKTRRKISEGIIIDFNGDIYSQNGIKIGIISKHNLMLETRSITIPKYGASFRCNKQRKYSRSVAWKHSLKKEKITKSIDSPIVAILCTKNFDKMNEARIKRKRKYHQRMTECKEYLKIGETDNKSQLKIDIDTPHDNFDSTWYRHYDNTLINVDKKQHQLLNTGQICVNAKNSCENVNFCCSTFNDEHHECHICHDKDCNKDILNYNTSIPSWTNQCFCAENTEARKCCCFQDSSGYYPDINMQHDCRLIPTRAKRLFKNSALTKEHQRKEIKRCGSDGLQKNITSEFATEADRYFSKFGYCDRCANFDEGRNSTSTIQKCTTSKASIFVESSRSLANLRDFFTSAQFKIDMHPAKHGKATEGRDEQPNKSDSQKTADTWHTHARVVAKTSRSDQFPREKMAFGVRGIDSKWKRDSIEIDAQQSDYKWKRRIAIGNANARTNMDFKEQRDPRPKTRSGKANADGKHRETRDYSFWTSLQMGKIWSQMREAYKNVLKFTATSVGRVVKDAPKSEHSPRNPVEVADAALVESSTSFTDKIYGETRCKNLMHLENRKKSSTYQKCVNEDVEKRQCETSMQQNEREIASSHYNTQNIEKEEIENSYILYSEPNRYQNNPEFLPSTETWYLRPCKGSVQNTDLYPQSLLSESFMYLKNSAYPQLRNRGGSDGNQDLAKNTEAKQKSMQYTSNIEAMKFINCHRDSIKICTCDTGNEVQIQHSQHVCQTPPLTSNCQAIRTNAWNSNNPSRHERQLTNVYFAENNMRTEACTLSQQTKSPENVKTYKNTEYAVTLKSKKNLMPKITEVTHAIVSPIGINELNEPIASTSKWETPLVSSKEWRENCFTSGSSSCAAAMKFCRRRSTVAPVFKRRRNVGRKKPSISTAATYGGRMKITQIEPSTVQTAREGNKRPTDVNVQMQTPDAILTRILSEFLVSGEKTKRVLMSITLQSESNHDVSHKETQTPSNNVDPAGINVYGLTDRYFPHEIMTASKMVQCFICDKTDCYEMKHSDNSITLEQALIEEFPEASEFDDNDFAKRKNY